MTWYKELFGYLSPLILLVGVIIGLVYYKRLNQSSRLVFYYLIVCLATDILGQVMYIITDNNLILWVLFAIAELLIFSNFFYKKLKMKKLVMFMAGMGIVYMIMEFIFIDTNATSFQAYSKVISSFLIVLMVILLFWEKMRAAKSIDKSEMKLMFGILVYYALNVVLLLPINFLINNGSSTVIYVWYIYLVATIFFYSLLTFLLWKNGRTLKP